MGAGSRGGQGAFAEGCSMIGSPCAKTSTLPTRSWPVRSSSRQPTARRWRSSPRPLCRATLKAAVKYPKVRFLNCSVDQAYSSIRTYYGRIYEAKFITGAIAGAMAQNNRIGYIASYPIFGVPASINAFAPGKQMTNPRAQIELRWSCVKGNASGRPAGGRHPGGIQLGRAYSRRKCIWTSATTALTR